MKELTLVIKFIFLFFILTILLIISYLFISDSLDTHATGYYEVSPDGNYTAMLIFFEHKPYYYRTLLDNDNFIFISKGGRDDNFPKYFIWMKSKGDNKYVSMVYDKKIYLPPSYFERFYAWIFVKVKGLNVKNIEMKLNNDNTFW